MPADPVLLIGNKNYSSWSLRPWLVMKVLGIPFEERRVPLYTDASKARILALSPSGKVPCLVENGFPVWDSLAIVEYLAARHEGVWPADPKARARARSVSAEMHAGFGHLREHMSMNVRKRYPGKGRTAEVLSEIERIAALWEDCRFSFGANGTFLFGRFSAADAMYAPVVLRFRTYAVALSQTCRAYCDALLALPALQEWIAAAEQETEVIPQFDLYG